MRLLWRDQPRVTLKVAVYLTEVDSPNDGAVEVVPRSHLDTAPRYPTEEPDGVPILGPAGTVAVFDARTDDAFTNTGSLEELDAFVASDMRDLVGS